MSNLSWWRSWHGAPTDHKWAVIAARSGAKPGVVSAVAWALFDHASRQPERGYVGNFDTEEYAVFSGFSEDEIKSVVKAMTDKGVIVDGKIANWEKYQPKREDDSGERVRKFREMKRGVTQGNAGGGDETPQSKSTDTDTEKSSTTPSSDDDAAVGELAPFEQVFCKETGLPPLSGGPERWFAGLKQIADLGATPEDFRQAIREQIAAKKTGRSYNCSSPSSFVTATSNIIAARNAKAPAAQNKPPERVATEVWQ